MTGFYKRGRLAGIGLRTKIFHYKFLDAPSFQLNKPVFTCSKLIIETLEQDVKHAQVNNKDTKMTSMLRSGVFTVDFEHSSHLLLTLNR